MRFLSPLFLLIALFYILFSIFLYSLDKSFVLQGYVLTYWITGMIVLVLLTFWQQFPLKRFKVSFYEILFLAFLVLISMVLRFYKITEIPILTGDEARDAGFLPEAFLRGEINDFFGYGIYGIPNLFFTFSSLPHLFFGHSVFSIRFLAALFGVFSVVLVYLFCKKYYGKTVAICASFFLAFYHVHLHFSRTEFINNFDSFWAPLVVILIFRLKDRYDGLLLGLVIGLSSHFYQGIRALLVLTIFYFLSQLFLQKSSLRGRLVTLIFFSLGLLAGLGPTTFVLLTRPVEFFNTGTAGSPRLFNLDFWQTFPEKIIQSYGSLVYFPIDFHYRYGGPFLTFPLNIFFGIGLLVLIFNLRRREYHFLLLWILFVIFFNSTILSGINYTHRLLSVVPALMIVGSLGLEKVVALIFQRSTRLSFYFLGLALLLVSFLNLKSYFWDQVWIKAIDRNTLVGALAGKYTASLESGRRVYFLSSENMTWRSVPNWEYLAPKAYVTDLSGKVLGATSLPVNCGQKMTFISLPERLADLKQLENFCPGGVEKVHKFNQEELFVSYTLK